MKKKEKYKRGFLVFVIVFIIVVTFTSLVNFFVEKKIKEVFKVKNIKYSKIECSQNIKNYMLSKCVITNFETDNLFSKEVVINLNDFINIKTFDYFDFFINIDKLKIKYGELIFELNNLNIDTKMQKEYKDEKIFYLFDTVIKYIAIDGKLKKNFNIYTIGLFENNLKDIYLDKVLLKTNLNIYKNAKKNLKGLPLKNKELIAMSINNFFETMVLEKYQSGSVLYKVPNKYANMFLKRMIKE